MYHSRQQATEPGAEPVDVDAAGHRRRRPRRHRARRRRHPRPRVEGRQGRQEEEVGGPKKC